MKNRPYPLYDYPPIASLPEMIRDKARSNPDSEAFRYRKGKDQLESRTYREVFDDVKRAACWMRETLGEGRHIAIIGENCYEWLLAFFSILSSGNVAVPIDKELPPGEISWMLGKADVSAVFISSTYADQVTETEDLKVFTFKELRGAEGKSWESYEIFIPEPSQLACILFTSGTSGHSKGVMLSHGNFASDVSQCVQVFDLRGHNAVLVLPLHHAFALTAAVLYMYHMETPIFINRTLKRVKDDMLLERPRSMLLVPLFVEVFYRQIMDGIKKSGKEKQVATAIGLSRFLLKLGIDVRRKLFRQILDGLGGELRMIICGGARLDPMYQKFFRDIGVEIINGYGASECSPVIAVNRNHHWRDGSVGQVFPDEEVKISDKGEVLIRGPIVMQGYYKDPEETAKAFRDGYYATGDLGYLDEDGFLFLTGRLKNLIILSNGENISPEELEKDFEADPAVNAVMVYDQDGVIVAEIFPEEDHLGDKPYFDALVKNVNTGRPAYKQVRHLVLRDEDFIRNTSKKIVRYKNIPSGKKDQK